MSKGIIVLTIVLVIMIIDIIRKVVTLLSNSAK